MTSGPKIYLLYYKALIDIAFQEFVDAHQDCFVRDGNKYIFSKSISRSELYDMMQQIIVTTIKDTIEPYDVSDLKYYFIIGACYPKDNLLLNYRYDAYFPMKLSKIIYADKSPKYILRERDIVIDMYEMSNVFIDIFADFFRSKTCILKNFGVRYENMIFVTHSRLDCYSMFKVLKYIFGKSNCINLFAEKFKHRPAYLVAVNDLIDKYVVNKHKLNSSKEFKRIIDEVKQFVNLRLGI